MPAGFAYALPVSTTWSACGPLPPWIDVELDGIAFLQALVSIQLDGAVVDKDIGAAVVTSQKAIALCVVEPLHCALVLCHAFSPVAHHHCLHFS